jgi:mycoredoxin
MDKDENCPSEIIVYGTTWCGDSRRARIFFEQKHIPFKFVDIDRDLEARKFVEEVNHGYRSVPTILFPDGTMLVEPTVDKLAQKVGQ